MRKNAHVLILAIGLIIHLLSIPVLNLDPVASDAGQFNNEAENIKNGIGWVNTEGPGQATATYPSQVIFLVICKYLFGKFNLQAAVIFQHLMVLATALIAYRVAMLIFNSINVALVAESIVIFFPHMIYYSNILYSHILGMFLSVLGIYLFMRKNISPIAYLGIGAIWAAATMARFTYQFFVPLYVIIFFFFIFKKGNAKKLKSLLKPLLFVAGFIIMILPWQMHISKAQAGNYGYSSAWANFYIHNRVPNLRGRCHYKDDFQISLSGKNLSRHEMEKKYREKALSNIREHPAWFINNFLMNFSYLLVNLSKPVQPHMAIYSGIYYSMLLAFGLIGIISMLKSQLKQYTPAIVLFIVIFGIHAPIYGYIVHSFPVWALFSPLVGQGIVLSLTAARRNWKRAGNYAES